MPARARRHGGLLGVDPSRFPRDFASFGRFHRELARLAATDPPAPLTMDELDAFLAEHPALGITAPDTGSMTSPGMRPD